MQRASDILTARRPARLSRIAAPAHLNVPDRAWALALTALGAAVFCVAAIIVFELGRLSAPVRDRTGLLSFVFDSQWDVVRDAYGALPFIYGTLVTSILGIVLAVPISVGLALFLTEMSPPRLRSIVSFPIEWRRAPALLPAARAGRSSAPRSRYW